MSDWMDGSQTICTARAPLSGANNVGVVKSGCAHLMFPGSDMSGWGEEEEEGAQHENTQFGSGGQGRGEDGLSDKYRKKSGSKKKGPATFARWLRGI